MVNHLEEWPKLERTRELIGPSIIMTGKAKPIRPTKNSLIENCHLFFRTIKLMMAITNMVRIAIKRNVSIWFILSLKRSINTTWVRIPISILFEIDSTLFWKHCQGYFEKNRNRDTKKDRFHDLSSWEFSLILGCVFSGQSHELLLLIFLGHIRQCWHRSNDVGRWLWRRHL